MNDQSTVTKTKVKTSTKVGLILVGAAAIAAAAIVIWPKSRAKVIDVLHIKKSTSSTPSIVSPPSFRR